MKLDVMLKTNLNYDTIVKEISDKIIEEYKNKIKIETELSTLLKISNLKNETLKRIYTIIQSSEYLIPFDLNFSEELMKILEILF